MGTKFFVLEFPQSFKTVVIYHQDHDDDDVHGEDLNEDRDDHDDDCDDDV